jgi:hypothetical protein
MIRTFDQEVEVEKLAAEYATIPSSTGSRFLPPLPGGSPIS